MKAIILGASGMVGRRLVEQLLNDDQFQELKILVRTPYAIKHAKLQEEIIDFDDTATFRKAIGNPDVIFSCIGTTMKNVKGDKQLYRKIDFDIPVQVAKMGYERGAREFVLVSSVGADPGSGNFYLKLKGEIEIAISAIPLPSVHIMQPSFLLGSRKNPNTGEGLLTSLNEYLFIFFIGFLKKYKPIPASTVARAMIAAAKINCPGIHRYRYAEMMGLIRLHPRRE